MTRVTEINRLDDLIQYRLLWNSLLPQTRGATFFQSFEWLETYWRHHGDRQRLRVLIVSSDDRPIGILPLTVLPERTRLGTVRVLTYPLDGWGTFFGAIGPNPTATLWAGLRHIHASPRDWDLVDLRWIDADGIDAGRTGQAMRAAGMATRGEPLVQATQIQLEGDWEKYWANRKARWRQNVARAERRLADCGELTYIRYRPDGSRHGDGDPRWDLYDACEAIARQSWQGGSDDGTTLSHESVRDYLRDAHETAATAGGLDLNLLLLDGRPAAFAYNYHYRGSVYGLRMGFDPAVTTEGSGSVLLCRMIENSFRRGDHLIDLGPGSSDAKRYWATRIQTSYHYPYYAPLRPKAQALRAKRWLVGSRGISTIS
ncbi:MAG TPA: GNAT family N-acetyltransferase [Pirellulales bacterium]|nr:GNAT family N-acetyltransferase [Pirellulales bacterium]